MSNNDLTASARSVQTLSAIEKVALLSNKMKQCTYDIVTISEVRWTRKGENSN